MKNGWKEEITLRMEEMGVDGRKLQGGPNGRKKDVQVDGKMRVQMTDGQGGKMVGVSNELERSC